MTTPHEVIARPDDSAPFVIGAILQHAEALPKIRTVLHPDDFPFEPHKLIFSASLRVAERGDPVDLATVVKELASAGQLERAGGWQEAERLASLFCPLGNLIGHARIVRELAIGQRAGAIGLTLHEQVKQNGHDAGARIAEAVTRLTILGKSLTPASPSVGLSLESPVAILRKSRNQGEPVSTGIAPLDERLRGGLRTARILVVGAPPGTGKTSLMVQLGREMGERGCAVAYLPPDEGNEPPSVRLGQQLGYERDLLQSGHEPTLNAMEREIEALHLKFPEPTEEDGTIEGTVEALVRDFPDLRKVFILDSIQTARTRETGEEYHSPRERVERNARTVRRLTNDCNLMTIYVSEMARGWYRARKEDERSADLAAFAETRAIEFTADVLLTLRASEEDPDLVTVRLPKNRLGGRAPFLMRLDRKRAMFTVVDGDPTQGMRDTARVALVEHQRGEIMRALQQQPRLTTSQLSQAVGGQRQAFLEALRQLKEGGLVTWKPEGRTVVYHLCEVPG